MAEAEAKMAELEASQEMTTELEAEVTRLTELVTSANPDKQRSLTLMKDKYLRELAKLEGKKKAEITELEKKLEAAEDRGFKEGEALYIKRCEAAKDLFFKCGWRGVVVQLSHGPETEVFNPPQYFIPSSLAEYAATTQQQFLEDSDEEETVPNDTPIVNDPACHSARSEPTVEDLTI